MSESFVTIIGSAYFESISALIERLQKYGSIRPIDVEPDYYTRSYSISICLLAVVCLESYVMRARFVNHASQNEIDKMPVSDYLKTIYPDLPYENEITEIHILRDIIAHNHLWEIEYSWDDENGRIPQYINKLSSGDKKYKNAKYVDEQANKTKALGLNVNPMKIDQSDADKVLHTMWKILLFLEGKDRFICYVSHLNVIHHNKLQKFGEVIGLPETCT